MLIVNISATLRMKSGSAGAFHNKVSTNKISRRECAYPMFVISANAHDVTSQEVTRNRDFSLKRIGSECDLNR